MGLSLERDLGSGRAEPGGGKAISIDLLLQQGRAKAGGLPATSLYPHLQLGRRRAEGCGWRDGCCLQGLAGDRLTKLGAMPAMGLHL